MSLDVYGMEGSVTDCVSALIAARRRTARSPATFPPSTMTLPGLGSGAGSALSPLVLILVVISTVVACAVSALSIYLHLKNYRKPRLQRMVVRIMLMVPIYALSSLISLFSLDAAFFIDALRDIYEAFVIYCFFELLLAYLGGERSLLILAHGREPKRPIFPINLFRREIDVSDPYTFLFLKRGILQYVQVKPILAIVTVILKAVGKYNEGNLKANSGYLYVSVVYNTSIFISLYCLAMFWVCVHEDLTPFRPMPKFLCVKGILFFSFWQSFAISILVAAGLITKLGPYTDLEHISLGLTDTLICFEMPLFAIAHLYSFSHTDYIDRRANYAARMPLRYAIRDAFGPKDVIEDTKATLRGEGMDYRTFEPAEGFIHRGDGLDRRIRAGLRYSKGGKAKYWLPMPAQETEPLPSAKRTKKTVGRVLGPRHDSNLEAEVYAPLLQDQADAVVRLAPDLDPSYEPGEPDSGFDGSNEYSLEFGDPDPADDAAYEQSRSYFFGDYNYPCIDVSRENARKEMWNVEEQILRNERAAWSPRKSYGAVDSQEPTMAQVQARMAAAKGKQRSPPQSERFIDHDDNRVPSPSPGGIKLDWTRQRHSSLRSEAGPSRQSTPKSDADTKSPLPPDAVDLVVSDEGAAEEAMARERQKGEPAVKGSGYRPVYKREAGTERDIRPEDHLERLDESDDGVEEGVERRIQKVDTPIATASSPPRIIQRELREFGDDENPWAT